MSQIDRKLNIINSKLNMIIELIEDNPFPHAEPLLCPFLKEPQTTPLNLPSRNQPPLSFQISLIWELQEHRTLTLQTQAYL